jgi:hypothetical protein
MQCFKILGLSYGEIFCLAQHLRTILSVRLTEFHALGFLFKGLIQPG